MGYRRGTVGVQEKSIKQHNTGILFYIYCNIMYTMNNTVVHTPQLTFHDLEVNIQAAGFTYIRLLLFLTFRLCLLVECEVLNTTNEHGMICFTCGTFYDTNFYYANRTLIVSCTRNCT